MERQPKYKIYDRVLIKKPKYIQHISDEKLFIITGMRAVFSQYGFEYSYDVISVDEFSRQMIDYQNDKYHMFTNSEGKQKKSRYTPGGSRIQEYDIICANPSSEQIKEHQVLKLL